ncbi:hypothetical protein LKX83_33470, partial [Cohnella sp. REN36]|nr:hypothetical protein [Cohnella sp. REN36]
MENPENLISIIEELPEDHYPENEEMISAACVAFEEKTGHTDDDYYQLFEEYTHGAYTYPEIVFDW